MCGFTRCSSANLFHELSTKWYWPMFSNLTKTHFLSVRCNKKSVRCNQHKSRSVESRSSRSVSVRWESVTWESVTCDPPLRTTHYGWHTRYQHEINTLSPTKRKHPITILKLDGSMGTHRNYILTETVQKYSKISFSRISSGFKKNFDPN